MRKSPVILSVFFLTVWLLIFAYVPAVEAQKVGIKISPIKIEDIVDPGEVLDQIIYVTNDSGSAKTMYAYLRDFTSSGETGTAELIAPGSEPGPYLSSWIEITKEGIEFAPNEQKEISYKIKVPSNQGPGGYYGAIVFGTEPPKVRVNSEDKGAAMSIAQQTGALVLLQVRGDVIEDANIREFSTDRDFYSTPFNVRFLTRLENSGNVFIKPVGQITIRNMFGKEIATLPFNEKGSNILQQSIRRFEEFWSGQQGFGRYTANLIISFGTSAEKGGKGKQTLSMEKYFWILPWRILIPGFIAVALIGVMIFLFLNFYKNKAVRRAMEQMGIGQVRYIRKFEGPSPALHLSVIVSSLMLVLFLIGVVIFFIFFA